MLAGRASQSHFMPGVKPLSNPDRKPVQPWGIAWASKLAFSCQEVKQLLYVCVPILFTYLANIVSLSIWSCEWYLSLSRSIEDCAQIQDTSIFLKALIFTKGNYLWMQNIMIFSNSFLQCSRAIHDDATSFEPKAPTQSHSRVLSSQLSRRNWCTLSSLALNIRNVKTVCSVAGSHKLCSRW